jgi:DNA-binding beta-propeller fold protein YncE
MRRLIAAVLLALAAGAWAPAGAGAWVVEARWGSLGKGIGEFGSGVLGDGAMRQYDDPAGIAVAPNGTLVVVDTSNNRFQRFTRDGQYLGKFGTRSQDKGFRAIRLTRNFFQPEGVAIDQAGSVYVVDSGNDRVMKHGPRGGFRARLGFHGSYPGQLVQPWDVAVGPSQAYVIDQGNYEIDRFTKTGRWLGAFGSFGRGPGEFVTPYGIAVSVDGKLVYVTDHIKHEVMVFGPRGGLVATFGGPGTGPGQFLKPAGIAFGPDGTLFVADRCNRRIQHLTADGHYIESLGRGVLETPTFLAVDGTGDVFVSDHHRVFRFGQGRSLRTAAKANHNGVDIQCRHVAELTLGE